MRQLDQYNRRHAPQVRMEKERKEGSDDYNSQGLELSSNAVRNEDSPRSNGNERLGKMPKHNEAGIVEGCATRA